MINILKANLNSFLKIFLGLIIFVFLINNASADPKELIHTTS